MDHLQVDFDEFKKAYDEHQFSHAVLVHLMGWAHPRLLEFRKFCQTNGIALLEDGAQSFGVKVDGASVYSGAQLATISFYPAKVLGGCMDGGAIVTSDPELDKLCRSLCNHGRAAHYSYSHVGWNSRMGALQGGYLLNQMGHIDAVIRNRVQALNIYREALADLGEQVKFVQPPENVDGNGYLCVVILKNADGETVASRLKERGIGTGRVYPEPMDVQPPAETAIRFGSLKNSHEFCKRVINLPLFYGISESQIHASVRALKEVLTD